MPFLNATRQNIRKIGTMDYEAGNKVTKDLPRTGLLANLYVRVKGTLTVTPNSGTASLKPEYYGKPYGLLDRLSLTANSGTDIVNTSGMGLAVRNMIAESSVLDLPANNLEEAVSGNPVFQFGTASGDNATEFTLKIPVMINDRDPVGLILLQNGETLMTLGLDWANPTNLFDLTSDATVSFSGKAHVTMEYFSVPANKEDYPDLSMAHTILEDKVDIDGTGDKEYTIPRGNIYMRVIHRAMLNASPAGFDDIDSLRLVYNQSESPYHLDAHDALTIQRDRYKRDLPQGVFAWDWAYQGIAGLGGSRDFINSKQITDFLSVVDVGSGATLGSNNNKLYTLREQLVPLG